MENRKPEKNEVVSDNTLRDSDLIQSFIEVLEYYDSVNSQNLIEQGKTILKQYGDFGYIGYLEVDENEKEDISDFLFEKLFLALDNLSPKNCYFGSHSGNGSCFGFFEVMDYEEDYGDLNDMEKEDE